MVVECGGLLNLTYESDSDKILVMRMGAIKAKRTLVIQGQGDNYNAGNQNYTTASLDSQALIDILMLMVELRVLIDFKIG